MLVSMKDMLQHALRDGYAVGQFNINNLEWVGAVLSTAQQCRSPVILGVSGGTVKHMLGLKCIHDIVVNAMEYLHIDVPVALHLDHGTSREACEAAIAAGFSSIMFDGSSAVQGKPGHYPPPGDAGAQQRYLCGGRTGDHRRQ